MARGVRLTGHRAWLALALAPAALAALVWALAGPADALDWQPARAFTEPWRWWTAALVHLSGLHLAANLAGAALVAALGREAGCSRGDALAWAAAWPLTHLALLLQPQLAHYGGLSGVLHAGTAVAALRLLERHRGGARAVGALVLVGLGLKIVWEAPWLGPVHRVPGWNMPIAPLAHATGAVAGLGAGLSLAWLRRGRGGR